MNTLLETLRNERKDFMFGLLQNILFSYEIFYVISLGLLSSSKKLETTVQKSKYCHILSLGVFFFNILKILILKEFIVI